MEDQATNNLLDSSDSETEFHGFDITDTRDIFKDASRSVLFTSTPKPKTYNEFPQIYSDSDDSLVATPSGEKNRNEIESDSGSDISGEIVSSIFQKSKRIKADVSPSQVFISPSSESEIEGELACHSGSSDTTENQDESSIETDDVNGGDTNAKTRPRKKGKHRSTIIIPSELKNEECCGDNCLKKLRLDQMQKARDSFCREYPTYEFQRKMILNWLDSNQPEKGTFFFSISGLPVCWKAWTKTLGITARRFYSLKSDYLNGRRSEKHGLFANVPQSDETDNVIRFLEKYFTENCDFMPNTTNWHLPSNTKRSDVFEDMCRIMTIEGISPCSNATFRKVWKTRFQHVKIPKENRFGKCDTCANIKEELRREGVTDTEMKGIVQRKTSHRDFVRRERSTYLDRCAAAHQHPNMYFSCAIDGMDQNKTEIPFSALRHSSLEKAWRLKVHVVGSLIHGRHPIIFLDYQQHPHDSNMTINILTQVLWIHRDMLPETLYIQLDNTCKENKNQHVFAFLAYLVEKEIFDKIEVSFLPVGHTHIDVDQMFSRLSVAIGRRGAKTFDDLIKVIHHCHTQSQGDANQEGARPQYARIDHMYAVREWLMPKAEPSHFLADHHQYRFTRNGQGRCIADFKPWCSNMEYDRSRWKPMGPFFPNGTPEGLPDLIKPSFEVVGFNRLESMVEKCAEKGILNNREQKAWNDFLAKEIAYAESYEDVEEIEYDDKYHKKELTYIACTDNTWPLDDLRKRARPDPKECPPLSEVLRNSEAYEKGEGFVPAYTGKYRPPKKTQSRVMEDQDVDLEVGMLVAVDLDIYSERPLIAVIKELSVETIVVQWYSGSWTTRWTPAKRKQGRQWVEWREEVPKEAVVLFDFSLTNSGKLRTHTIKHLKESYTM